MNLTRDNYFSNKAMTEYMSCSQYKDFLKCPSMAMARLNGKFDNEEKQCFIEGSFMDSLFECESNKFIEKHPEMISSRGVSKGCLKSNYQSSVDVYNFVKQDTEFMKYCTGQQQVIMTGTIGGVEFKIMIDSLLDDIIVDRKFVKDFKSAWSSEFMTRVPWFMINRYDLQGAIYQEIIRQNIGKQLPFALAGITKEKVPDHDMLILDQYILDTALTEVKEYAPTFQAYKDELIEVPKCGICDWCKLNKKITVPKMASELIENGEE